MTGDLGCHVTLLAGATVPVPLPPDLTARVVSVTVTESDHDRSAFTVVLDAGRSGPLGALDTPVLGPTSPLRPGSRVVVVLTTGVVPHVLADGIVTETELTPGSTASAAELRVTGHDLSVLLDRRERSAEHVALEDSLQALAIAAGYAVHGVAPLVVPPADLDPPLPIERTPTQQGTDWSHLQLLARRHGYVCCMVPGPFPGLSTLYWGPPVREGLPQPALAVDCGPATNVIGALRFREDALTPEVQEGRVMDRRTGVTLPVRTVAPLRVPQTAMPTWATHAGDVRVRQFRDSGVGAVTAFARAQATTDRAADAVTCDGTLDGAVYGDVLRPRALVGLRGAGWSHDGLWYVRRVVHQVRPGAWTADFSLTRDGLGSTVPVVRVR
ncbi:MULTISPECIES: hypothetical protein [unclassified Isoptericola]|uniref:hypothetical protein n=1 Tax=unclassified Isoptericola TaxID=2623355 RepID=UPI00271244D2|nr:MULTISPECIES: hypothetical protein [unclassified Isoptericola]MDO8149679.1 hypothetical protein [Isoptericola sp. b515]MDO8152614.1 hypothetical protein [Isoptericola sp. b408]